MRKEVHVVIEVLISESSLLDKFVLKLAFRFHHEQ